MTDLQPTAREYRSPFPSSSDEAPRQNALSRLIEFDRTRPGFPGEHLAVAAVGGWLVRSALRRRSRLAMLLSVVAGGLLLARAASGRDGLARLKRGT